MVSCVHYCQSCLDALKEHKEAKQYYDYFCHIHACINQIVLLTEPLDDEEKYCLNLLENKGYLISTEISGSHLAILPITQKYNNVNFYCSRRSCKVTN